MGDDDRATKLSPMRNPSGAPQMVLSELIRFLRMSTDMVWLSSHRLVMKVKY